MKIGINMLLWTPFVTGDHFPLFGTLKAVGYDGVEMPMFDGTPEHYATVARALADNGLGCTAVTVVPSEDCSPISADARKRRAAVDRIKWAVDCSEALGADVLCGPYYQPLGVFSGAGASATGRP